MNQWLRLLVYCLLLLLPFSQAKAVLITLAQPKLVAGGELEILVEAVSSQIVEPELELPASWQVHFLLVEKMHQVEARPRGDFMHRWSLVLQHQQADSISRRLELSPLVIKGYSSQPLQLDIQATRKKTLTANQALVQPLTMHQDVDFSEAYLGQSLVYELIIRYQGFPLEPRLSPLEIKGATARQLGEGREQGFNQRGVKVQEARWREILQLHATEITLAPRYFSSRLSQLGQAGGKLYEVATPELKVKVRPVPKEWPADKPWLPAWGVNFEAAFLPHPRQVELGQALELNISLDVVGQQARNLPQFKMLASDTWQIEPLTEELSDKVIDGFLVGSLKQRVLLYPKQSGKLQLPNLTLHWWDVRAHKAEMTQVKLGALQVMPGNEKPAEFEEENLPKTSSTFSKITPYTWVSGLGWLFILLGSLAVLFFCFRLVKKPSTPNNLPPLNP